MIPRGDRKNCTHSLYIHGLCGHCGIKMEPPQSTVSMIHDKPELKFTEGYANRVAKADQDKLIKERKLVLLVDLDQTILHTTHEQVKTNTNVHSFKLWPGHPTYYTKLRPYLQEFLDEMANIYELHIFTFGCRMYAHKIASIIDPDGKYFGKRILSRDECVDPYSKQGNLSNLFPRGDAMVCIIDDRADVWRDAGNLIQVKPYSYFKTSISDGAIMKNNSAEEEESLERDVDKLEALLAFEDEDNKDEVPAEGHSKVKVETESEPETKVENESESTREVATEGEVEEKADVAANTEDEANIETKGGVEDGSASENDGEDNDSVDSNPRKKRKEESREPSPMIEEDLDDQLLHLPKILSRIHEKWYMELDEQRRFLVPGEKYKMPDIKDIIRRYLRKKYDGR